MSDPEGNSFVFPRVLMFPGETGFPIDLTLSVLLCFYTSNSTNSKSDKRIRFSGANQNSRLGTYKNTILIFKTTE